MSLRVRMEVINGNSRIIQVAKRLLLELAAVNQLNDLLPDQRLSAASSMALARADLA
ncbi:MAG: hypothetical protein KDB23_23400 [Planctomycetales bacterium]|nr:hypothetical protein [Planctomycetales bacterium]